jgi:SAM-dependent methyltransferase
MHRIEAAVRTGRRRLEVDMLTSPNRRYYSPVYYAQYQVTLPLMEKYAQGRLIDLGCGDIPFRDVLLKRVTAYDSLDLFPQGRDLTYVADIQDMSDVPDGAYDTALCLEVLEHVPDPFQATREICRILAPGGVLIISVPHLSRLHAEPHDYYRYTRYGLRRVLEQADLEVVELHQRGAVFTFLGHQLATAVLTLSWGIPVLRQIAWFVNRFAVTHACSGLDRLLPRSDILAAGYTAVARRPALVPPAGMESERNPHRAL